MNLQDEWNVFEFNKRGGWILFSVWNNNFCLCICHVFVLCNLWLPRWKAFWRKKSYRSSCKRFNALWILAGVSKLSDWDNFIICTTNHIQRCLFDIIYKCIFDRFSPDIFAYSNLYSTYLRILSWWMCECWRFHHETEEYHMEIHFNFVQSFPQLFNPISRCTLDISNVGKRSKLWKVTYTHLGKSCNIKLHFAKLHMQLWIEFDPNNQ